MVTGDLAPAALPQGLRVYAIGDVHGCADRLAALHARIRGDLEGWPVAHAVLLHLGDYVDRGPDSARVVDLIAAPEVPGVEVINIFGNHEQMMLDALHSRATAEQVAFWLENGGGPTLESYGADPADPESWLAVPDDHLAVLASCRVSWRAGGYFFAHAGVRPEVPLEDQDPDDLAWIREPFLSWPHGLEAVVVHGHTPSARPEVLAHRIGLDTGAVFGGPLTCAVLEDERIGFLFA